MLTKDVHDIDLRFFTWKIGIYWLRFRSLIAWCKMVFCVCGFVLCVYVCLFVYSANELLEFSFTKIGIWYWPTYGSVRKTKSHMSCIDIMSYKQFASSRPSVTSWHQLYIYCVMQLECHSTNLITLPQISESLSKHKMQSTNFSISSVYQTIFMFEKTFK